VFADSDTSTSRWRPPRTAWAAEPDARSARASTGGSNSSAGPAAGRLLDTAYLVQGKTRFTNLRDDHELYCLGHLIEGGVALRDATGRSDLLEIAVRYADLVEATFGDGPGKRPGYCGHPEIELASSA